jgi:hypothetical protein
MKGIAYPLRLPTREPLYRTGWELARDLDMLEERAVPAAADDSS